MVPLVSNTLHGRLRPHCPFLNVFYGSQHFAGYGKKTPLGIHFNVALAVACLSAVFRPCIIYVCRFRLGCIRCNCPGLYNVLGFRCKSAVLYNAVQVYPKYTICKFNPYSVKAVFADGLNCRLVVAPCRRVVRFRIIAGLWILWYFVAFALFFSLCSSLKHTH